MMRELIAAAAPAALVLGLGLGLPQSLMAQEPAPTEVPAEAAPDGATAPEGATAEAAEAQPVTETIPVQEEPAVVEAALPTHPYTYAALRFTQIEYDESEADGFGLEGSYLLMPSIFVVAAYSDTSSDDAAETESGQYEIGAGFRGALSPAMDFNAAFRVLTTDNQSASQSALDLGYRFDAGVRGRLASRLEGNAALSYVEGQQHHHGFFVGSALYELMPQLSLGAEVIAGNSSTSYGVLGRWAF